jgi:hypothetical protein
VNLEQSNRLLAEEVHCPKDAADPKYMAIFNFFGVIYLFLGLAIIADDFFCPALGAYMNMCVCIYSYVYIYT